MEDLPLEVLTKNLFKLNVAFDKWLVNSSKIAQQIQEKYEPRTEFNRWRDSVEGKLWKQQKYLEQNGCCAICNQSILLKGSHIDHIKPLFKYPDLALDPTNLQITCSDCNISKNDSE